MDDADPVPDRSATAADARPRLRLKPKADARRIRRGHPWAWQDELVLDRRARAVAPGALAVLEDAERRPLGLGTASVDHAVALRLLDRDPDARIDAAWLHARLQAAADLRARLPGGPYHRLVHAEGDDLPGLIVDRFGDVLAVQPNARWIDARLDMLVDALVTLTGAGCVVVNRQGRARVQEGLETAPPEVVRGTLDGPIDVPMGGAIYRADLLGGQKTGLFLDQRPNHAVAAGLARGARVLDVFAHVGGFALACLAAGAVRAVAVDASDAALALARAGARATGVDDRLETRTGDGFEAMAALAAAGARFDLVIADPPAFAPAKPALEKGLRAYERVARLAADLVAPGGVVMLCSCSHAATPEKFRAACLRGLGRAGRQPRLIHTGAQGPDHPQHPALTETGYLKVLAFRLMP